MIRCIIVGILAAAFFAAASPVASCADEALSIDTYEFEWIVARLEGCCFWSPRRLPWRE